MHFYSDILYSVFETLQTVNKFSEKKYLKTSLKSENILTPIFWESPRPKRGSLCSIESTIFAIFS